MVDDAVVKNLVSIGRSLSECGKYSACAVDTLRSQDAINRIARTTWNKVANSLDDQELIYLVMGLTAVEQTFRWSGGSVAAVIWVFHNLQLRVAESVWSATADWVLAHTTNPYLPFGSQNHGAKSLHDYQRLEVLHQSKIQAGIEVEKRDAESAKRERALRARQRRISHCQRREPERKAMIACLEKKSLKKRFEAMASDETHTVNYYPTNWAHEADIGFISTLDENLRYSLARKLKGKQRGSWASFKRRLLHVTGIPWNRRAWF